MMDYKEEIIDHYKHPRNFGEMENADVSIKEGNASCGDMIQVEVKLSPTSSHFAKASVGTTLGAGDKRILKVAWRGIGCAISTAAASMLSEKAIGMSKEDLEKFGEAGIIEMLGGEINAGRIKCATLAYKALLKVFEK